MVSLADADWECYQDYDAPCDDSEGHSLAAGTPEELSQCRLQCLSLGFGGFVVRKGQATFRGQTRSELLELKTHGFFDRGAVLYVLPDAAQKSSEEDDSVQISFEEVSFAAKAATLASQSGYFASAFRHSWQDGGGGTEMHRFQEFPGGQRAFELALVWLSTAEGMSVGHPWPIEDRDDACLLAEASMYLDAPALLRAGARSWRLAAARSRQDMLRVAGALAEALSQFPPGEGQEIVVQEMRDMLQELPKHQLQLASEFTTSPIAGLAALEARIIARETLVGHIKTVGNWMGSVIGSGERRERVASNTEDSPHDFAVRLFELHEQFFLAKMPERRRLLRHVDPSQPIAAPLCFRIAAAAALAAAEEGYEVFAGKRLAVDIFEHGLGVEPDPASAASDDACVCGLFGASQDDPALGLEVLARPLVPPAAAAVILGRVLASWAAGEVADASVAIYDGVASDRQGLRAMLQAALPRIEAEDSQSSPVGGTEWGSSFDLAVPELRAAFAGAASAAVKRAGLAGEGIEDETLSLLFNVLFRPTGGLPGVSFPLNLLSKLPQPAGGQSAVLAAERAIEELKLQEKGTGRWQLAQGVWSSINWDVQSETVLEEVVALLRRWLLEAEDGSSRDCKAAQAASVRLFGALPLQRLAEPEELLGPPVPAHVLATLARREQHSVEERLAFLESENTALRIEIRRLRSEIPGSH